MRLMGRRILITGAASGIGLAIAAQFAKEGAALALIDKDGEGLKEAYKRCGTAALVATDLSGEDAELEVHEAIDRIGGLNGLVNCVGTDYIGTVSATDTATWQRLLDVNLTVPYRVCKTALRELKAAGDATIVNIAADAGLRPMAARSAYCAANAGLIMFSKSLAMDVAADGIRVNVVCPGLTDTPLLHAAYNAGNDQQLLARVRAATLMNRLARAEEIAAAALFLTSEESSFITGIALAADGGHTF